MITMYGVCQVLTPDPSASGQPSVTGPEQLKFYQVQRERQR